VAEFGSLTSKRGYEMATLREQWKAVKEKHKAQADWTKLDKMRFGSLLDVYEEKLKAYHAVEKLHAMKPDQNKQNAAKTAAKDAAKAASQAGAAYMKELLAIEKSSTGPKKDATTAIIKVLKEIQVKLVDAMAGKLTA
jgi:hypothetical protein